MVYFRSCHRCKIPAHAPSTTIYLLRPLYFIRHLSIWTALIKSVTRCWSFMMHENHKLGHDHIEKRTNFGFNENMLSPLAIHDICLIWEPYNYGWLKCSNALQKKPINYVTGSIIFLKYYLNIVISVSFIIPSVSYIFTICNCMYH